MSKVIQFKQVKVQEAINAVTKFNGNLEKAADYLQVPVNTLRKVFIERNMWRKK